MKIAPDFPRSAAFTKYKNSYMKTGADEIHREVFQATQRLLTPKRVLYPGCHRHLTASLAFSNVLYMDCDKKVADVYQDDACREFIMANKFYDEDPHFEFQCADVLLSFDQRKTSKNKGDEGDRFYDLFISLSAGILSPAGIDLLEDGGFALLNDSHSDARSAFVNPHYTLYAVWEDDEVENGGGRFNLDETELVQHFCLVNGDYITNKHVEESIRIGSVSKRSFNIRKTSPFYLFQKTGGGNDRKRKHRS